MSAAPIDAANKFKDDYRLPTNARPTHYDITLRTDLEKHTFSGFASIDLDILKETHSLTFNAVEGLALQKCSLVSQALKTEQSIEPTSQTNADSKVERVTVTFGQALPEGSKATLQVGFEGTLGDSMLGELTLC